MGRILDLAFPGFGRCCLASPMRGVLSPPATTRRSTLRREKTLRILGAAARPVLRVDVGLDVAVPGNTLQWIQVPSVGRRLNRGSRCFGSRSSSISLYLAGRLRTWLLCLSFSRGCDGSGFHGTSAATLFANGCGQENKHKHLAHYLLFGFTATILFQSVGLFTLTSYVYLGSNPPRGPSRPFAKP